MWKYIILFLFFVSGTCARAQEKGSPEQDNPNEAGAKTLSVRPSPFPGQTVRNIADKDWQHLTEDPAFAYNEPESKKKEDRGAAILLALAGLLTSDAGLVFLWLLLGLLLVYIVFRMTKMKGSLFFAKKDRRISGQAADADGYVPEDWGKAMQEAANSGDYRLAVRYVYRYLLLLLSEHGKISYQTAKTNHQYAYELAGTELYQPFMQLTRQYEYAWYGGFQPRKQQFEHCYALLKKIQSGLR